MRLGASCFDVRHPLERQILALIIGPTSHCFSWSSLGPPFQVWDANPLKDELVGRASIPLYELTIHADGGRMKEADAAGTYVSPGEGKKTRFKVC